MSLERITASFEISKKLKELEMPQNTSLVWLQARHGKGQKVIPLVMYDSYRSSYDIVCSAPTFIEIWKYVPEKILLPEIHESKILGRELIGQYIVYQHPDVTRYVPTQTKEGEKNNLTEHAAEVMVWIFDQQIQSVNI